MIGVIMRATCKKPEKLDINIDVVSQGLKVCALLLLAADLALLMIYEKGAAPFPDISPEDGD